MKLVAFTGQMGSGKSTAIEYYRSNFTNMNGVNLIKFAAPLYDIQSYVYNRIKDVYIPHASFVKDRKLLQWLGTEWGRGTISSTLWVDLWKAEVTKSRSAKFESVVCDDCRFDNEAEAVKSLGGVIIQIVSDKASQRNTAANGISNHSSEAGIRRDYIDDIVPNHGSIEDFHKALKKVFKKQNLIDEK